MGEQTHRRRDWRDTGEEERSQRTWLLDHTGDESDWRQDATGNWQEQRVPKRRKQEAGYQLLRGLQEGRRESSPGHGAVLAAGCLCPVTQASDYAVIYAIRCPGRVKSSSTACVTGTAVYRETGNDSKDHKSLGILCFNPLFIKLRDKGLKTQVLQPRVYHRCAHYH